MKEEKPAYVKKTVIKIREMKVFVCFVFFPFLGPLPTACGGSQARGQIGAVAANLYHSHINAES